MKLTKYTLLFITLSLLLSGCGKKESQEETSEDQEQLEITKTHFESSGMTIGTPQTYIFAEEVSCRGYLTAPANANAKVSTPIAGAIESVLFKLGDSVRRGQTLCTVTGNEFFQLQQEYAEAASLFEKAKLDYERMKMLQEENIGAKKDYISSESIYKSTLASYNALKARIRALNINPQNIEEGKMYTAFPVVAPISGYITGSGAVVGQYIELAYQIAQIVDVDKLQLQLSVFDRDVSKLSTGQEVRFALSSNTEEEMTATLVTVGRAINPETKSIDCIAQITDQDKHRLVNESFVEAKIIISHKEALGLPTSAVQKTGNNYFVYVVDGEKNGGFLISQKQIEVGSSYKEHIEVTGGISSDTRVLTQGIETL
ncbi:MAG: efflux RND transporter periplasmic adaptor subunit [Porphyromonas sp.]|nr:efflux RND transporter periplasmic adaptor subunit [Porphyromonas sp.]